MHITTQADRIATPILGNAKPKSRLVHDLERLTVFIHQHDLPSGDLAVFSESGMVVVDHSRTAWPAGAVRRWARALDGKIVQSYETIDGKLHAVHEASGLTGTGAWVKVVARFLVESAGL